MTAGSEGITYEHPIVNVYELDDGNRIRRLRGYNDKLGIFERIAAQYPGVLGWVYRRVIGYLGHQGEKGLDRPVG